MTPSKDDSVEVSEMLGETAPASEGINLDDVDSDFEQELEDLFSDDLAEDGAVAEEAEGNEPIMLDEIAENMEDSVFEDDDVDEAALEAIVQPSGDDDDELILLDEIVEEDTTSVVEDQDLTSLVEDIAEESPDDAVEEIIMLDDLAEEEEEVADLDALLEAAEEPALDAADDADALILDDVVVEENATEAADEILLEEVVEEAPADEILLEDVVEEEPAEELLLEDVIEEAPATEVEEAAQVEEAAVEELADELLPEDIVEEAPNVEVEEPAEEISFEPEDMMDAALAEDNLPEVPVEDAVPDEELEMLLDEPEEEEISMPESQDDSGIAELAGIEELESDDMEDMDSLLDNVEVDVSDLADDVEALPETDLGGALAAEVMPADSGIDISDEVSVDELLADVVDEDIPTVEALQSKVALLEARVEDLETRLRDEIAQLVPAEAARIIREEITALAQELDD